MTIIIDPEWLHIGLYAGGAALFLLLVFNIPFVGKALRFLVSAGLLAFCLFLLSQQAPFHPGLTRLTSRLGLDGQQVAGGEVRIPMSPDGHFWARARINGVERRLLIDSGATITALSRSTAQAAAIDPDRNLIPLLMQTANGTVRADSGTLDLLQLGPIEARGLKVVISPAFGEIDILGMNFLSLLGSWRVEGRTLILTPEQPGGRERAYSPKG